MAKTHALIITSKDDAHADYLIYKANENGLGLRLIRINTEEFVSNCEVTFTGLHFRVRVKDSARSFASEDVKAVWYRRPHEFLRTTEDPDAWEFIKAQASACLRGLYFCTHESARWINPLPALHRSRNKLQQLQLANQLGFRVPKTLVSNDPEQVTAFCAAVPNMCSKSLDEPNFRLDGEICPIFTRIITPEELAEHLDAIPMNPTLFQEYIIKQSDIRVTVVGQRMFATEISSQGNELSVDDFRGVSPRELAHINHILPDSLKEKILAFTQAQGLFYSAMDFALGKDGEYYFLENNPNGQWLWLEQYAGAPISDAILEALLGS